MDSLTHIAIGACMGDAFAGKQLRKRAMFLGAVAQSVPDIDFLASFWTSISENLLAHRGFTHSFLFVILVSPLLAWLAVKLHKPHDISYWKWVKFFGIQALIHLLLDGMNVYGVGWFEPFSHERISYNWIYVADPFFSIWIGIAFVALLILRSGSPKRAWWIRFGVGMSAIYLMYCGLNKFKIDREVRQIMTSQNVGYRTYFTTPTPMNSWLWYVVAANDSGYHVGYRSVFDKEKKIKFRFVPRNKDLFTAIEDREDLRRLIRFSRGYYTLQKWSDSLVYNDLRFGEMIGWRDSAARFSFYYYLDHQGENKLLVQRGRFQGWDGDAFRTLWERIKGN